MPKEVVHGDGQDNAIQVGWSRDTYVQMGSVNIQADNGWFVDMSRDMINKLIKILRKARDQAYGADE